MKLFPGVLCLLFCAVFANGQTFFWHRDSVLPGAGGIAKSYNWTSAQDGAGQHPASVDDDGFPALDTTVTWKFLDKDGVDSTGSAFLDNGRLILRGRGADFTKEKQFFTGIHRKDITGNFDVSVKVDSQVAAHDWSKAGIMMSNHMERFDSGGVALVALTPNNGAIFEVATEASPIGQIDYTVAKGPLAMALPVWLRLVKSGTTVSAYYRTDSATAWIQIGGPMTPKSTLTDSDIGLFVVGVDSVGKTVKTTAAAFDNFLGGGDIADPELHLRFDGTGPSADVDVVMAGNFAARSLDFTGFTGKMSFNSHTLSVSGKARFVPGMTLARGTGSLAFTGTSGSDTLWVKPNDTLPNIRKTGAASLALMDGTLYAPSLRIEKGSFDLNGNSASVDALASAGGTLKGLGADDSLIVKGDADFSGLAALDLTAGAVSIRNLGAGTTRFNPGGKTFPRLTLWTMATAAPGPTLVVGPGSLIVDSNLVLRNRLAAAGTDGTLDFKTHGPSITVKGDILQVKDGTGASTQKLLLGKSKWSAMGNVGFSMVGGTPDSAVFRFVRTGGAAQNVNISGGAIYAAEHDSAGTLKLIGGLSATHFRQAGGTLDFNGSNIALKGNLDVLNGTPTTLLGLGGRTLTVEGNATFAGQSASALLGLNPASVWFIKVTGTLKADSADIANSDARGFSKGKAGKGSKDSQGNFNWEFWAPPQPPVIVRDPLDVVAKPGWKVSFSTAVQGTAPFTYEWRQHGDSTVLSTDTVLTLDLVKPSQSGTFYYCVASNDLGKDTTRKAELTVRNCDSAFVAPANLAVTEGNKVVLAGKTGCATDVIWTAISGPVPRLLDPGVDTLAFTAPRIKGDTTLVLEFSAHFGASRESKQVTVTIKDSIPDPVISLETVKAWTGAAPKVMKPKVGNGAELAKFPGYPVRYLWSVSPLISDSTLGGDSLVLLDPFEDGNMDVSLCVDNGGTPSCVQTVVEIKRMSVSIRGGVFRAGPVRLSGHRLDWIESGRARVLDWSGRVLWESWGSPGYSRELPARAERSLRIGAARLEFVSAKRIRR
jgi:hypothetical protein